MLKCQTVLPSIHTYSVYSPFVQRNRSVPSLPHVHQTGDTFEQWRCCHRISDVLRHCTKFITFIPVVVLAIIIFIRSHDGRGGEFWQHESIYGIGNYYEMLSILEDTQSEYQSIMVFESRGFGKVRARASFSRQVCEC